MRTHSSLFNFQLTHFFLEIHRQYHLQYDLVKLKTGKMSGRRGRYLLADDLYNQLKEEIRKKMAAKYEERGEKVTTEFFDEVIRQIHNTTRLSLSIGFL